MRAPSPTYFCTNSLPITRMKHASVLLATARASSVLPVPATHAPLHHNAPTNESSGSQMPLKSGLMISPTSRNVHAERQVCTEGECTQMSVTEGLCMLSAEYMLKKRAQN
jgi:hypothetical protein